MSRPLRDDIPAAGHYSPPKKPGAVSETALRAFQSERFEGKGGRKEGRKEGRGDRLSGGVFCRGRIACGKEKPP